MSNFLTNLVNRSAGAAEVVQPRVPSIYEPHRRDSGQLGTRPGAIRSSVAAVYDRGPFNQSPEVNPNRGPSNQTLPADQDWTVPDSAVMPGVNPAPTVAA